MIRILFRGFILLIVSGGIVLARDAAGEGGAITGKTIFDTFQRGGVLMWPILLCSVVTLAFVFERLMALRTSLVFPRKLLTDVRDLVGKGEVNKIVALCSSNGSQFGKLLHACLTRVDASGFEMEAALEEAGSRTLFDLRKNSRPLGVIGDVSPLLGLMGTVLGMIKAFEVVARTGALGRTELLAQGIGEALLTTAFGLGVAVPSMIFYHYFRGKADDLVRTMEDACLEILGELRKHGKKQ